MTLKELKKWLEEKSLFLPVLILKVGFVLILTGLILRFMGME